jgi:hypothetical protein
MEIVWIPKNGLDCHNGNATKKQPFERSTKTPQKRHVWKMSNEKTPWKQKFGIINKRKHIKNRTSDLNALPATCLVHTQLTQLHRMLEMHVIYNYLFVGSSEFQTSVCVIATKPDG